MMPRYGLTLGAAAAHSRRVHGNDALRTATKPASVKSPRAMHGDLVAVLLRLNLTLGQ